MIQDTVSELAQALADILSGVNLDLPVEQLIDDTKAASLWRLVAKAKGIPCCYFHYPTEDQHVVQIKDATTHEVLQTIEGSNTWVALDRAQQFCRDHGWSWILSRYVEAEGALG
jgi:hypothetical protein